MKIDGNFSNGTTFYRDADYRTTLANCPDWTFKSHNANRQKKEASMLQRLDQLFYDSSNQLGIIFYIYSISQDVCTKHLVST